MIYLNKKMISNTIANVISEILYPVFLIKTGVWGKFVNLTRSFVIKKYIIRMGGKVGKNFLIGKNCVLKIQKGAHINISDDVCINENVMLNVRKNAKLNIGNRVHIGFGTRISAFEKINIANDVLIASYVNILDHNHKYNLKSAPAPHSYDIAPIEIFEGVWLGTKVQINKGVTIGRYCVIGSNSVVTKSLEYGKAYGGIPVKQIF